jgi:GMP synthase-like glutamine amidotransferase
MSRKILFLQVREPVMEKAEQTIVFDLSQKSADSFECRNFLSEDLTDLDISQYSHVIMGGSSAYNLSKEEKLWFNTARQKIRDCETYNIPFLGLCYGMQFLASSFGAKVIEDPQQKEAGPKLITTFNTQGTFLEFLPQQFMSNMIHNDSVVNLPDSLINLGSSDVCENALIMHKNGKMFGTQFHSEINKEYLRIALNQYAGKYGDPDQNNAIIQSSIEPEGKIAELIPRFLSL